tara:strand:+ start:361 stop:591 length:231 start_codon:yes stop_codon:yes gene_type:complete
MDNILLLIKKRNQFEMKINNKKCEFKKNDIVLENIKNEIIKYCCNNFKCHDFIPENEPDMYGETFYVCCICGYENV